ncbi:ribonuclease H-like domain-containing protein [Tanacetum coccineum]
MDPNSSLGKICLGDDVIVISSDKVKGSGDWNFPEYQDTTGSQGKKVLNSLSFYKMETYEVSERYIAPCFVNGLEAYNAGINIAFDENLISNESFMRIAKGIVDFDNGVITVNPEPDPFEDDSEKTKKSPDDGDQLLDFNFDDVPKFREELPPFNLTQEEAAKEALAIRIIQKFALLEEVRLVLETMAYHDKYKKGRVNKNALADTGSDINTMPYRIYEQLGREEMKKVDREITMINHTQAEAMGILTNVLCQVGVTTLIAMFLILDIPINHDVPIVVGQGFLCIIGGIVNTPKRLFSTFDGFCHQTFRAARSDVLRTAESDSDDKEEYEIKRNKFGAPIYGPKPAPYLNCTNPTNRSSAIQATLGGNDDKAGSSRAKHSRQFEIVEQVLLPQVHREFLLWGGCSMDAKSRYNTRLTQLLLRHIYSTCIINWDILNRMGCDGEIDKMLRIKVREAESNEEIFTYVAWIRAFNINEPIYSELCHEFYSTYEFDEMCADNELQSKKIIKFRLGGHAYRGLRSDRCFNTQEYWLSISREENLSLSRSHASTIRYPVLRVVHKMITYGLGQRTTGKTRVLTDDVTRSLSASIYYRYLDTTTLREFIDSEDRLIPEDP